MSSHYHILYYAKPGGRRTFNLQSRFALDETAGDGRSLNYRDREDVWTINREYKPGRRKNKNELPKALLQKILTYSSKEGDLVCDFFMGGGSTAAVAIGMNRRFVGFEVSERTFRSRVPELRKVVPGSMLEPEPAPHVVRNRGKSWSRCRGGTLAGAIPRFACVGRGAECDRRHAQRRIRARRLGDSQTPYAFTCESGTYSQSFSSLP